MISPVAANGRMKESLVVMARTRQPTESGRQSQVYNSASPSPTEGNLGCFQTAVIMLRSRPACISARLQHHAAVSRCLSGPCCMQPCLASDTVSQWSMSGIQRGRLERWRHVERMGGWRLDVAARRVTGDASPRPTWEARGRGRGTPTRPGSKNVWKGVSQQRHGNRCLLQPSSCRGEKGRDNIISAEGLGA